MFLSWRALHMCIEFARRVNFVLINDRKNFFVSMFWMKASIRLILSQVLTFIEMILNYVLAFFWESLLWWLLLDKWCALNRLPKVWTVLCWMSVIIRFFVDFFSSAWSDCLILGYKWRVLCFPVVAMAYYVDFRLQLQNDFDCYLVWWKCWNQMIVCTPNDRMSDSLKRKFVWILFFKKW